MEPITLHLDDETAEELKKIMKRESIAEAPKAIVYCIKYHNPLLKKIEDLVRQVRQLKGMIERLSAGSEKPG